MSLNLRRRWLKLLGVHLRDHNLSDAKLVSSSCPLLLWCFTGYDSIVAGLGGGVSANASAGVGFGVCVGATAATMQPHLVLVQVIEIVICCLDGVFEVSRTTHDFGIGRHVSY